LNLNELACALVLDVDADISLREQADRFFAGTTQWRSAGGFVIRSPSYPRSAVFYAKLPLKQEHALHEHHVDAITACYFGVEIIDWGSEIFETSF
jgi:hypothetical protein